MDQAGKNAKLMPSAKRRSNILEMEKSNSELSEEKNNLENHLMICQTENNLNLQSIPTLNLDLM